MATSHPELRPVEQLVLQGTSFCNLNCTYCDLSEKSRLTKTKMPLGSVYQLIGQLILENLLTSELVIVWHSGEPLTLPPQYYTDAIEGILNFCQENIPELSVSFDFQTNATLINDAWCDFFEQYSEVVNLGVSCDGPSELHDSFRVDWKGRGTYERTLRGMEALESRGIRYNLIAVVTKKTLGNPKDFFDYFFKLSEGITDFHFNILASPIGSTNDLDYGIKDRDLYYSFYRNLFDFWVDSGVAAERFPIRNFSQTLQRLASHGVPEAPQYLKDSSAPLRSLNMDAQGNITSFYAGLDIETEAHRYGDGLGLRLGNIQEQTLADMLHSSKLAEIINDFNKSHDKCASSCEYYSVCPGGFELIQMAKNNSKPLNNETSECIIHVKTLTDAVLDAIDSRKEKDSISV